MLAIISEIFGARYATYEAGKSSESEFSALTTFSLPHPLVTQALCCREISINLLIGITVRYLFLLVLIADFTKGAQNLSINALKYIILINIIIKYN